MMDPNTQMNHDSKGDRTVAPNADPNMDPDMNLTPPDRESELAAALTAYALGELEPADAAAVEARLAEDPALAAEVEEIRRVAGYLQSALGGEAGDHLRLDAKHRRAIAKRAKAGSRRSSKVLRWAAWTVGPALAAGLIVAALLPALGESRRTSRTVALLEQVDPNARYSQTPGMPMTQPVATPSETADADGAARSRTQSTAAVRESPGVAGVAPSRPERNGASGPPAALEGLRANGQMVDKLRGSVEPQMPADIAHPVAPAPPVAAPSPAPHSASLVDALQQVPVSATLARRADQARPGELVMEDVRTLPMPLPMPAPPGGFQREAYDHITDNPFLTAAQNPLSTFSIDVDTASYANIRRFLTQGQLPPAGAVRIEEMINYFPYAYSGPADGSTPFAVHVETGSAPWAAGHRLVKIGIKGREIVQAARQPMNLVFLIDVSGSMNSPDKLPLLREGMKLLVQGLDARDHVAIVVYAGAAGMVLDATPGHQKQTILGAIDRLQSGGSTNGGAGIRLAYDLARKHFREEGINRVILASDGDFNVGTTSRDELVRLIEEKRKSGVFLSVLGFGTGNLNEAMMEQLANKGNGNYAYIDSIREAKKVLVDQMAGTLVTIAKDVKIQVEFNPAQVQSYRLIGYENRMLAKEDFNDDTKDAGEIGAGHTVTALYEVVPVGVASVGVPPVDELKYQPAGAVGERAAADEPIGPAADASRELLTVKLRYKEPAGSVSTRMDFPVVDDQKPWQQASVDFRFAAAVAQFGMLLRNSPHKGTSTLAQVLDLAQSGLGVQPDEYRLEFIGLVQRARALGAVAPEPAPAEGWR